MRSHPDMEHLKSLGYINPRWFDVDHWAAIIVLPTGQYAIVDGDAVDWFMGYQNRWNYAYTSMALTALGAWDGDGEPEGYESKKLDKATTIWP